MQQKIKLIASIAKGNDFPVLKETTENYQKIITLKNNRNCGHTVLHLFHFYSIHQAIFQLLSSLLFSVLRVLSLRGKKRNLLLNFTTGRHQPLLNEDPLKPEKVQQTQKGIHGLTMSSLSSGQLAETILKHSFQLHDEIPFST